MKFFLSIFFAALILAAAPTGATAAVLGTYTHDYGKKRYIPQGSNRVTGNSVRISETATDPFFDSFNFSGIVTSDISSISLTLTFAGAGTQELGALAPEAWDVSIGSSSGPTSGVIAGRLDDNLGTQTFVLDASADGASATPFADALSNSSVGFWFDQNGLIPAQLFMLQNATLTVSSTVVPLPAPIWLLLTALGGLAVARRARKTAS